MLGFSKGNLEERSSFWEVMTENIKVILILDPSDSENFFGGDEVCLLFLERQLQLFKTIQYSFSRNST